MLDFKKTTFLKSAAKISQLPPDTGAEVAFIGRSNAGKSSALNLLTGDEKLARVSKTPGRTQLLNFFSVDEQHRLVDLPGYGYAAVPVAQKIEWQKTIDLYLQTRESLKAVILLMDIRHPIKPFDQQIISWSAVSKIPLHILLSKADKISQSEAFNVLRQVKKAVEPAGEHISAQLLSVLKGIGVNELRAKLSENFAWLM
jgi:GTP-binding protein